MTTRYDSDMAEQRSNTIAAIFAVERDARSAIKSLHKSGFKKTWLGKTREADRDTGEPMVEATDAMARFLSAGMERRPLHKALVERGVSQAQAESIEADIAPGCTVVTVYGEDNPQRAAELLADDKGQVIDASGETPTAVDRATLDPRTGVDRERNDDDRDDRDTTLAPPGGAVTGEDFGDIEGYETEEFISTGRGVGRLG